jgi:transposase
VFFKFTIRKNPLTHKLDSYYRLVEGLRDENGKVKHRTLLNIGFLEDALTIDQINIVCRLLNNRYQQKQELFAIQAEEICIKYANEIWDKLVIGNKIDPELYSASSRKVEIDKLIHKEGREIGAEWMCYNTLIELGLDQELSKQGFSENEVQLALTQIISRAVYPASELHTTSWIKENSGVCDLTKYDINSITKDKLYQSAIALFGVRKSLESHLSKTTNELFDITDKILLYGLTNTYFEGRKEKSKLAKFGRSKEKRSDAKIIVLALAVNTLGFIKYHAIHEGNISDTKNLDNVLNEMSNNINHTNPIVLIDAGIATKDNLKLIANKGYKYVCVNRVSIKEYEYEQNRLTVMLQTKSKKEVLLKALNVPNKTDFFMEVKSEAKTLKERSMKSQFEERFIELLIKAQHALGSKGGIIQYDKVIERIAKAKAKYPSAAKRYNIQIEKEDNTNRVKSISWHTNEKVQENQSEVYGKYFIRTNIPFIDEVELWNIYNIIREIESTFKTLKSELDLRPVYYKSDKGTLAHLHLGILAYWVVNTIRQKLKPQNINTCWTDIVRIANTQKIITTEGTNTVGKRIRVKKCSEPNQTLNKYYSALLMNAWPFTKKKSVVHKLELKKTKPLYLQASSPT